MKPISKIFAAASTLFLAGSLFAAPSCPPASVIAGTQFTKSKLYQQDIWILTANDFTYQNQQWNTLMGVNLPNMHSDEEALTQGQNYFKSNVSLSEPELEQESGYTICIYANESGKHGVIAANPPLNVDGMFKFKSSLSVVIK